MASTCYLEITAIQRPFSVQIDAGESREVFSVNFSGESDGEVSEWEEDLVRLCVSAGVPLALNTNTLIGRRKPWPTGAGPFARFIDTGGVAPNETHNGDIRERLSAQVVVIGRDFDATRSRALAIWRALDGVRNTTVASP